MLSAFARRLNCQMNRTFILYHLIVNGSSIKPEGNRPGLVEDRQSINEIIDPFGETLCKNARSPQSSSAIRQP